MRAGLVGCEHREGEMTTPGGPVPSAAEFEKLGAFYLGRERDVESGERGGLVLYDSRDLVTHAVCVGMTGSGKTGLCIGLLEEAAIDGIPAIVIDPKGDLSNLLLTFPELKAADFEPWVNADDAVRKCVDVATFAQQQAALWSKGLAEWGQDGARIARMRSAADFTVYTPGSTAGTPVSVLKSFDAPGEDVIEDAEAFRERVSSTTMSLLGLAGLSGDAAGPTAREHILIAALLSDAWARGKSIDLPGLITAIQTPPASAKRIGVMELEAFYPAKERFGLAMALNNLIASPGFSRWLEGETLDIGAMLRTSAGKPRVAIFSIAHLGDAERMFFVSLLLNQVLGWVRMQSGTSSLRAIVYMDEIAGYFPPTANPPSKPPLLTLMKQGRAFGVGVVLATQNPVDLDYKGLANAGTWFIGRLQTERDKARVLDGLEGAAANAKGGFDRSTVDQLLSRLGSRVFLMNNIHDDGPTVFETRWCLSYLRGPLTREQIKRIRGMSDVGCRMADVPVTRSPESVAPDSTLEAFGVSKSDTRHPTSHIPPQLPPDVPQYFVPVRSRGETAYQPMLLGIGKVYYVDAKSGVDAEVAVSMMAPVKIGPVAVDWDHAAVVDLTDADLEHEPEAGATFASLPPEAAKAKNYAEWKKGFVDALYRTHTLELLRSAAMKMVSQPDEDERGFRDRLAVAAREQRDAAADKLRAKFAPKVQTLEERLRRARQAVEVQKEQSRSAKMGTALSVGSAILGAFLGKKTLSSGNVSRAATAVRGAGRAAKESSDVGRAEETVEAVEQQLADLQLQFKAEIDAIEAKLDVAMEDLEKIELKPKKTGITVKAVVLAWQATES